VRELKLKDCEARISNDLSQLAVKVEQLQGSAIDKTLNLSELLDHYMDQDVFEVSNGSASFIVSKDYESWVPEMVDELMKKSEFEQSEASKAEQNDNADDLQEIKFGPSED
jgi:hypothetical protein